MGVTQQAASKAVAELEALGYVERGTDPVDARIRRVGLSTRGREMLASARRVNAEIEAELSAVLGVDTVAGLKDVAWAVLEWSGGAEAVRTRRVSERR